MVQHLGANRKVIERATGNVYQIDFIVDSRTPFGFQSIVSREYKDRDIVCDHQQKVFRPEEVALRKCMDRVKGGMREMFNLIAFERNCPDKRK